MLPVFDTTTADGKTGLEATLVRLRASSSIDSKWYATAAKLIDDVRARGDEAIVAHMREFTDASFTAERIRVSEEELAAAERALDPELRGSIERAISHVREYQEHVKPRELPPVSIGGAELGLRWTPIVPVGLLVPGGSAVLFSTLIMLAVPALVAGVRPEEISVATPMPYRKSGEEARDVSPITLAVAKMLGIGRVYRIGGPPAVAALAFGTDTIPTVNFIAGPGHPVVQAAKLQLRGYVGTDDYYGASEIVTLIDDTADPRKVASDLLAQAEHDPGKCFLIAWSSEAIERVRAEMSNQASRLPRREAIERALVEESCAVLVEDLGEAVKLIDRFAAEHVNLAVDAPEEAMRLLRNGGEFFLGDTTPVAAGDYYAGPSHTLPTGTTARFASGVSAYTFLKRSGTVRYPQGMPREAVEDTARMAEAEGLAAHAESARTRSS